MSTFRPPKVENKIFLYSLLLLVPRGGLRLLLLVPVGGLRLLLLIPACGLTLLLLVLACGLRLLLLVATGNQSLTLENSSVAFRLQLEFWFSL